MSKRKRTREAEAPVVEPEPEAPVVEASEAEAPTVEPEPEPAAPLAPAVQTLEGEYLGMRAMKVEEGVYYALPAWLNIDGYKEGDRVRITVEFERVELLTESEVAALASGGVEPTPNAESETESAN